MKQIFQLDIMKAQSCNCALSNIVQTKSLPGMGQYLIIKEHVFVNQSCCLNFSM